MQACLCVVVAKFFFAAVARAGAYYDYWKIGKCCTGSRESSWQDVAIVYTDDDGGSFCMPPLEDGIVFLSHYFFFFFFFSSVSGYHTWKAIVLAS
jgi:hypothetical protein